VRTTVMIKVRPCSLRARARAVLTPRPLARPQNIPNKLKDYEVMAFIEEVRDSLSPCSLCASLD